MPRANWLTRNVVVLSAVSLAQDAASELLYPVLPILLTRVLGAPDAVVGIVEGVAEGFSAVTKYLAGRISDILGRKPLVGAGYGLAAVGKLVVALASVWPLVLVGRVIDRIGKGMRGAPRDALLATDIEHRDLGKVFGFHRASDTAGAVIGPLVGLGVLAASHGDVRLALWVALVPATISALLVTLAHEKREVRAVRLEETERPNAAPPPPPVTSLPGPFRRVVAVLAVFSLANFPDTLILLRVSQVGFSAAAVVGAYALYNAAYGLVSYPAGALSDRMPRGRVYALGLACFAAGYLGLGLATSPLAVLLLLVVYGGFQGFTDGVGKAWITALVPSEMRGRAQGVFQATLSAAILLAGIWAGLVWDLGPGHGVIPLLLSGGVGAVSAAALWVMATPGRRGTLAGGRPA